MPNELNFTNLTVKYDGEKSSKKEIRKVKTLEALSAFITVGLIIGSAFLFTTLIKNVVLLMFISVITMAIILFGGGFGLSVLIEEKIAPKHYRFITWLMRFKRNEIEIGWMNNRYVVQMFAQEWKTKEFNEFIPENYHLIDNADKAKPLHMTIDLTKDKIEVIVENTMSTKEC